MVYCMKTKCSRAAERSLRSSCFCSFAGWIVVLGCLVSMLSDFETDEEADSEYSSEDEDKLEVYLEHLHASVQSGEDLKVYYCFECRLRDKKATFTSFDSLLRHCETTDRESRTKHRKLAELLRNMKSPFSTVKTTGKAPEKSGLDQVPVTDVPPGISMAGIPSAIESVADDVDEHHLEQGSDDSTTSTQKRLELEDLDQVLFHMDEIVNAACMYTLVLIF